MSETFDYNGNLAVDETLVVDTETMEVSKDGSPDYTNFDGDLLHVLAGDNTITYTDDESSRTVEIEVIKSDRYA